MYIRRSLTMFDIKIVQIADVEEFDKVLKDSGKLVVCAGRWGPMCIPVYNAMEKIEMAGQFKDVLLRVVDFDGEPAGRIRNSEECRHFRGLPFTVYYLNGEIVHATSSIQPRQQLEENIKKYLYQDNGGLGDENT